MVTPKYFFIFPRAMVILEIFIYLASMSAIMVEKIPESTCEILRSSTLRSMVHCLPLTILLAHFFWNFGDYIQKRIDASGFPYTAFLDSLYMHFSADIYIYMKSL